MRLALITLLLGVVLAVPPCFAIDVTSCSDVLSTASGSYVLQNALLCPGSGPTITATNVTFDLNGKVIQYARTTGGNAIVVSQAGAIIKNGTITKGAFDITSADSHAIVDNGGDIELDGITFNMTNNGSSWMTAFRGQSSGTTNIHNNTCLFDGGPGAVGCIEYDAGSVTGVIHSNLIRWESTSTAAIVGTRPFGIHIVNSDPSTGRLVIHHNNTLENLSSNTTEVQHILAFDAADMDIHGNSITGYGSADRMINLDKSSNSNVYQNTLDGNGSGNIGIRARYSGAFGNAYYENTIDFSDGTGNAFPMFFGAESSTTTATDIHHNTVTGGKYLMYWSENISEYDMWNNTLTSAANTTAAYYFLSWHDGSAVPGDLDNNTMNNDELIMTAGGSPVIFGDSSGTDKATNITFCNVIVDTVALDAGDVTEVAGGGTDTYTITTSSCLGTTPQGSGGTSTDLTNEIAGTILSGVTVR